MPAGSRLHVPGEEPGRFALFDCRLKSLLLLNGSRQIVTGDQFNTVYQFLSSQNNILPLMCNSNCLFVC